MGLVFFDEKKAKAFFCCKEMRIMNEKGLATGNVIELWNDGRRAVLEAKFCPFCGTELNKKDEKIKKLEKGKVLKNE